MRGVLLRAGLGVSEVSLRRVRVWVVLALAWMVEILAQGSLRAQSVVGGVQPMLRSSNVEGFGPDAQLVGGLGFGLDGKLDNYFLARARLGALYAKAPWIVNFGLTVDVGALAGLGWGGELELSRGGALFGAVGVSRIDHARWLMHVDVGYSILGLEWQHMFDGPTPNNALLLEVRLPLGLWWLQKRQEKADAKGSAAEVHSPQIKQRIAQAPKRYEPSQRGPVQARAQSSGSSAQAPAAESGKGAPASDPEARAVEYATHLAEAQAAREKGDRLAEAFALSRAYALRPEPSVALQLVAAQLALGKPRSALADWQRVGDVEQLPAAERERSRELGQQLSAALSHLRIELDGALAGHDECWIDGVNEPIATQGYDVPLDPGDHVLQVRRGDRVLVERAFQAQAGALVRLNIELPR